MRGGGGKSGVQGPPRLLNHARFPAFRKYRRSVRCRAQPLYLLTPAGRFALHATAHRADAPLRRAHGFAALANIGVLCAGRAQPLYLLTPSGRFGPLAQVPTGHTLPFGAPPGRFGPLAQQPTGLTLPSGAPKTCAAAQNASVASAQRAQETRHAPPSQKFHERPSASIKKKPPAPAQAGTGGHKARRINQANGFSVGYGSDAGRL